MMARNPDSVKEEAAAAAASKPLSNPGAYNPQYGNPLNTTASPTVVAPTFKAAGTVETAQGPVQVDAQGRTADGSLAISVSESYKEPDTNKNTNTTTFTAPDGKVFSDAASYQAYVKQYYANQQANANANANATKIADAQSAYDLLQSEFNQYGLGALVEPLKNLVQQGASGATLSLALQNTDAYKQRFSANAARVAKGLSALNPAQYIAMEDQYQNVMRQYGLPSSYYTPDSTGKQPGFDQLLSNDVSATELNDRISTAQNRVMNANPEVLQQLKIYYPDITNGDILSYALNPANALDALKRKVTASEIGGAAAAAGLSDSAAQAEQLAAYGITGAQAQQQYGNIAQLAQRGNQLASIYNQQPYGQNQATAEIFNLAGQTEAQNQRKKLTALEQAQFAGQGGTAQNAFSRERAISPMMLGVPGAGSF